jgi:hypothetical protein
LSVSPTAVDGTGMLLGENSDPSILPQGLNPNSEIRKTSF